MDFNEFQREASKTVAYPLSQSVVYPALGLVGESGEVANKLKKVLRGDKEATYDSIPDELGDVLWYIAAICTDLGVDLGEVADKNIQKLRDRQARGVIKGSGDNR